MITFQTESDATVAHMAALCLVSATVGPFDCTFDDDDYCGYSDKSEGPVKWIRSKAHQHTSPGDAARPFAIK